MNRPTHTVHQGGFMGIGGEDVQVPDPLTLGEVLGQLPDGAQIFQVTTVDANTHKPVSSKAVDPAQVLQPGDAIEIVSASGQHFLTHVNADASDVGDVTPTSTAARTSPQVTLPTQGTSLERQTAIRDQTLSRYNDPTTPESEKAGLLSLLHATEIEIDKQTKDQQVAGGKDADTQALAAAAVAKRNAGETPTQQELTAYFKVNGGKAPGQPGQYVMPIPGYSGQLAPHHAGNENGAVDLFAPPGSPVVSAAKGTVVRAGPYGAAGNDVYIQGDDGRVYDYEHVDGLQVKPGDMVQAGQPLAVVATLENGGSSVGPATHLHFAVGAKDGSINYDDHGTASDFDTLGFLKGISSGQPGALNGILPPPKPEIHALGNKLYQYDPTSGKWSVAVDATDLAAPTTHQIGNILYQWNPGTKQWTQAIQGPQTADEIKAKQDQQGKVSTLIQQAQSTKDYIQQQLSSGAITPQQADQYMGYLNDYTGAALQGTTPWERYQQQQQLDNTMTSTAKDLLDTKLQQTTSMATSLLGDSIRGATASKYGQMAPGTLSGVFQGALDTANQQAQPLSNLAQQLLATVSQHAQAAGLDPRIPTTPPPGMPALPAGPDQTPAIPLPAAA